MSVLEGGVGCVSAGIAERSRVSDRGDEDPDDRRDKREGEGVESIMFVFGGLGVGLRLVESDGVGSEWLEGG